VTTSADRTGLAGREGTGNEEQMYKNVYTVFDPYIRSYAFYFSARSILPPPQWLMSGNIRAIILYPSISRRPGFGYENIRGGMTVLEKRQLLRERRRVFSRQFRRRYVLRNTHVPTNTGRSLPFCPWSSVHNSAERTLNHARVSYENYKTTACMFTVETARTLLYTID